jgi:hypothetical protein
MFVGLVSDTYWFTALMQKYFRYDGGAFLYSQARRYALKGEYSQAVRTLENAIKFDRALFGRAESDVAFEKLRTTLVYKIFAQDMTNEIARRSNQPPNHMKHTE